MSTGLGFRPPVITGMTTLNEGDTLYLDCDTSNSRPRPSAEWFSLEGVKVSNDRFLESMNIQRSAAGIYTCLAILLRSGATMNSTVNVIVQCKCYDSMYETCTCAQMFIEETGGCDFYQYMHHNFVLCL